ncbi:hypothetical protein [Nostoc sp.]|uniref:hypothetical protein n=1 Tax=Nostoc sp. TaxID=1180 RepID=UPI002FF55243
MRVTEKQARANGFTPFYEIPDTDTWVGAYKCTPLQPIHVLQSFLSMVSNIGM